MPVEGAAIRCACPPDPALELSDPNIKSDQGQERAEYRGPNNDLAPERSIAAQMDKVHPVRDRAEPVPEALCFRCPMDHLAGCAGDVDIRPLGIVEREAEQRTVAIQAADGPLIGVHLLCKDRGRRLPDDAWGGGARDRLRVARVDANDRALLKVDTRVGPPKTAQPHRRYTGETLQLGAKSVLVVSDQPLAEPATCRPGNRRQRANALILGNVRKADIHHDGAGREPHHHQNADRYSQISMRNNQGPPQATCNICHAGHRRVQRRANSGGTGCYNKLAANYLAFVRLASIRLWLRVNESTI